MKISAFVVLCLATALPAQTSYLPGPESEPQPGVPKGVVTRYELPPGRFYPGTPHSYAVYVPAKYDATKPAPFMVFFDGNGALGGMRVPVVFDNLIAKGDLPPLIGIFVEPGVLPALSEQAQNRYERIFEYDSVSGRYARFLIEELIPAVGAKYNLSANPDDHALSGNSTGAVGAFVAAWHRPDQFHRVLSIIGTFVDMKGAEELASLVRKTEPKPIRIHLQVGKNDHIVPGQPWGTFYAGSWPINNQVMYDALSFAGYDAKFVVGEGAHDSKHATAMMPDALRWLWADHPKPITVHEPATTSEPGYDPRGRVYSIFSATKPWEPVGGPFKSIASLAADKDGFVFFSDSSDRRIYRADPDGKVTLFMEGTAGTTALKMAPDGRLLAAQPARHQIVSYGPTGDEKSVAQDVMVHDLAVTATGRIYFTTPGQPTVSTIEPNGSVRVVFKLGENSTAAGLALSPDQAMLVVSDGRERHGWSLQIAPDGSLRNGEPYYRLYVPELVPGSTLDGVTMDSIGQVYFASALGIQVTEQNGRVAAVLNAPIFGAVEKITFGGKELEFLYATEGNRLFRRPVKIKGAAPWVVSKPPKPPL